MAIVEQIHVNDYGTTLKVLVKDIDSNGNSAAEDVSAATTLNIILKKPDGTKLTKTASFSSDGTDGYIQYVTEEGDIDTVGDWELQAYIVEPSGAWYTDIVNFKVYSNL